MNASAERITRKRIKPQVGDLVAIDLADKTWGLAHIVAGGGANTCYVLFARRAESVDDLRTGLDEALSQPIGVLVSNDTDIKRGTWPIVSHRSPDYPGIELPKLSGEGATWWTPGFLPDFVEACLGLRAWDEGRATPGMYRAILLPHLPIPPTARFQGAPSAAPAPAPKPPPVTEGPAMVTLQIVYPGKRMPSTDLVRKRQEMERRLEAEGAGEVDGAESGAGVMEVYLRTDDVRRTLPLVEKIAAEMGFADDMLIETAPLEDDDDDEEGDDDDA